MANGLLQVSGTIDTAQFWPEGESDGDTVKVLVDEDGFSFRPAPPAPFQVTHVFDGARVRGRGTKAVLDKEGRINIRLQGIDAAELHFRPTFARLDDDAREAVREVDRNFRQFFGVTAAIKLAEFLKQLGDVVPCKVVTAVDEPNDVCDTYGRVVGDIIVRVDGQDPDVNHWMAANGWAFPAFYSSMSGDEITQLLDLARQAQNAKRGIWPFFSNKVAMPDFEMVFPKRRTPIDPESDAGTVLFPKFFRRSCTWAVSRRAGLIGKVSFKSFLASEQPPDSCFLRAEFLTDGVHSSTPYRLDEFVRTDGTVEPLPQDLVFKEAKSTLLDANGQRIEVF